MSTNKLEIDSSPRPPAWKDSFTVIKKFVTAQEEIDPVTGHITVEEMLEAMVNRQTILPLSEAVALSFRANKPKVEEQRVHELWERFHEIRNKVLHLKPDGEDIGNGEDELVHTIQLKDKSGNIYTVSAEENGQDWIDIEIMDSNEAIHITSDQEEGELTLNLTFDTRVQGKAHEDGTPRRVRYEHFSTPTDVIEAECRLYEGVLSEVEAASMNLTSSL